MMGTIKVKGIRLYCYHGCMPEEEKTGGWYEIDVEADADIEDGVRTDDLANTANYVEIIEIVRNEMGIRSKLVEHVTGRIARAALKQIPRINEVVVTVSKLHPPVEGEVERFSVSIKMKRSD